MPRPGQNAYRKRQLEEAQEEGSQEIGTERSHGPVLPVADLPDDWEGEAEDGATYLALVSRANASLPTYTSVPNPYRQLSPPPAVAYPDLIGGGYSPSGPAEPVAGPSRHPALPRTSWEQSFSNHWKSYRKVITSQWPPSPSLPYPTHYAPLPNLLSEPDWTNWLNGTPLTGRKKRLAKESRKARKVALKQAEAAAAAAEAMAVMKEQAEVEAEVLEDTFLENEDGEEDMDIEAEEDPEEATYNETQLLMEEDDPVYDSPEPLISVIQVFTSYQIIRIMKHIAHQLETDLEPLEQTVLPAQPDSPGSSSSSSALPSVAANDIVPNPLSSHTTRWIFALLAILDEQLMGDQISTLRDLARIVMRAGGWRWVRAVVSGEIPPRAAATSDSAEENQEQGTSWELGQRWRLAREAPITASHAANGHTEGEKAEERTRRRFPGYNETGVDETLARCWMIIHCIADGWAQRDLLEDLETLFK